MNKMFGKTQKTKIAIALFILAITVIFCVFFIKSKNNGNIETITSNLNNYKNLSDVEIGTVTLFYLDEEGNTIKESEVNQGNVGEVYYFERADISGYTYVGDEPITKAGKYELGNIDVNFVYKKSETEFKVDTENKGIDEAEESVVKVEINNTKSRAEYPVKIITVDEKGTKINGGEFEFYSEGNEILRKGTVINDDFYVGVITISNETEKTHKIIQTQATAGYGKIEGDILLNIQSEWDSETNKYKVKAVGSNNEKTRAYINDNGEIIVEVTNQKYADMYEMEIIYKTATEMLSGKTIKIEKGSQIIKEDKVENGKLAVGSFEITNTDLETYTITEGDELIDKYKKILTEEQPGKVYVQKKESGLQVTCDEIDGFLVDYNESSKKITIYIETEMIEEVVIDGEDKYDLAIKKFVAQIDGQDTNRAPEVKIEDGKVKYIQTNEITKVCNNQEVSYVIQIYNESEVTGYGKRIIEYIPDGLVYLPENEINQKYGWIMYAQNSQGRLYRTENPDEAVILLTDYLVNKEISGIDNETAYSVEVQINFKVDETKLTSEDRIIENTVVIWKNDNDDNLDNNETSEKLYVKYFDLDVQKYIEQVVIKNESDGKEQTKQVKDRDELLKIDVKKSEVNNTTLTITYDLEVKNIGEIEGYATEVIDYIPENFELVEDGVWKIGEEKNIAVTTKLENKLLQPGEITTIPITFRWKLTEDNIGSRINEAKIKNYENPYDAKDLTEENNGKREILVTIRTGGVWYCITAVIIIAVLSPMIIVIAKKRKNRA